MERALTFHRLWATRRPVGRSRCRPGRFQVAHSWSLQLFLRSARLAEPTEAGQNRPRKDKSRRRRIDGAWPNHRLLVSGELEPRAAGCASGLFMPTVGLHSFLPLSHLHNSFLFYLCLSCRSSLWSSSTATAGRILDQPALARMIDPVPVRRSL